METLIGDAAEAHVNNVLWRKMLSGSPGQHLIHVLTPYLGPNGFYCGTATFNRFLAGGPGAVAEAITLMAADAVSWPYVLNAQAWAAKGNVNSRILIYRESALASPRSWQNFACRVQWPTVSALTGESVYLLTLEQCYRYGLPLYTFDVNLWGTAGSMRAGYQVNFQPGVNDEVTWRQFGGWTDDPERAWHDFQYTNEVVECAWAHGTLIQPAAAGLLPAPVGA